MLIVFFFQDHIRIKMTLTLAEVPLYLVYQVAGGGYCNYVVAP